MTKRIAFFFALIVFCYQSGYHLVDLMHLRQPQPLRDSPFIMTLAQSPLVFDRPKHLDQYRWELTFEDGQKVLPAEDLNRRLNLPFYFDWVLLRHWSGASVRNAVVRYYLCAPERRLDARVGDVRGKLISAGFFSASQTSRPLQETPCAP